MFVFVPGDANNYIYAMLNYSMWTTCNDEGVLDCLPVGRVGWAGLYGFCVGVASVCGAR